MELIFPNLYRIEKAGNRGRNYAYFIKRRQGNLLLNGGKATVHDHLDEFEAIYFPSCGDGLSLFRWRNGGKHFLFTSHVIQMRGGDWNIGLRLDKRAKTSEPKQFAGISQLPMDYILPNVCRYGQEGMSC